MKIFITGATGLIGLDLCAVLQAKGHKIVALTRSPAKVEALQRAGFTAVLGDATLAGDWITHLQACDAVVHLAGENLFTKRWSEAYKAVLRSSRVDSTRRIAAAVSDPASKVKLLLCGSAIGYYGADFDKPCDEFSPAGQDFLAQLCVSWERAACVSRSDVRIVFLRSGIVLSIKGGALQKLLPLFKCGFGGKLGSGKQMMSWIHIEDWVRAAVLLLENETIKGAFNLTSPYAVTNENFVKTLASVLHRPSLFSVPAAVMKMVLGESAVAVLGSQHVRPRRLTESGFAFSHPQIHLAIANLLKKHQ